MILLTGLAVLSPSPVTAATSHGHTGRPFISPMGEPFFGGQSSEPLAAWFAQADSNRDGSLTLAEMQTDADRFFGLLDINHDGEIDPDEITHYEQVIAPMDREKYGLFGLPEPVTAADTDFSRGISLSEFEKAAQLRFQALDVTHQGRLTLAVLQGLRPPGPAREKRDPDAPPELDPNADTGG
jgi:Ca2+-binding EF-hand superfamily protein